MTLGNTSSSPRRWFQCSVSPVNSHLPATWNTTCPAVWPGAWTAVTPGEIVAGSSPRMTVAYGAASASAS